MKKFSHLFSIVVILFFFSLSPLTTYNSNVVASGNNNSTREVMIEYLDGPLDRDIKIQNNKTIVTYESFSQGKEQEILQNIKKKIQSTSELISTEYYDYYPETISVVKEYFYSVLSSYPKLQPVNDMLYPRLLIAVGEMQKPGYWDVVIEGINPEFNATIQNAPIELLNDESKQYLKTSESDKMSLASNPPFTFSGLPWTPGTSWNITNGVHGSNDCCVDFQKLSGGEGVVRAAEAGVKIYTSGNCIFYKNGDHSLIYQHINPDDIALAPQTIDEKNFIGRTYTEPGCGYGSNVPHHVHFGIWTNDAASGIGISGSSFNGWTISYDEQNDITTLTKGSSSVSPINPVYYDSYFDPCVIPSYGIWYFEQSCQLYNLTNFSGYVIIDDNVTVTINPYATLNLDLLNKRLLVRQGGKLYIKYHGKLQ